MEKEILKKGILAAEKEQEEKQIQQIKKIVQNYLELIDKKQKEKNKIDEEIRILKKDLDDFKSGRLDKIAERNEKDEIAKTISPIVIKIIRKEPLYQPWRWIYAPTWNITGGEMYLNTGVNGTTFSTFTSGVYNLTDGNTINL